MHNLRLKKNLCGFYFQFEESNMIYRDNLKICGKFFAEPLLPKFLEFTVPRDECIRVLFSFSCRKITLCSKRVIERIPWWSSV